jgi:hypothetical protein
MRLPQLLRNNRTARSSEYLPAPNFSHLSYNICRKKFAKLKIKFELGMREHEALLREELRIQDLSKRIQEQNE